MKWRLVGGILFSGVCLFLALRSIEWRSLRDVLLSTRLDQFALSVVCTMASHYVRAYRWKFILRPVKAIGTNSLFSATCIGLMANNLLPARLGEVVRAYVLGREQQVSKTAAFGAIVYERVVDVFSLLGLLWLALLRVPGPDWLTQGGRTLLILNAAAFGVMFWAVRRRQRCLAIATRCVDILPNRWRFRLRDQLTAFVDGLGAAGALAAMAPIAATSVVVWGCAVASTWFCLSALSMPVPASASLMVVVVVAMGTMIPSAPAYLGTLQYACILALAFFQVGKTDALAFSLLFHASQFVPTTAAGLWFLSRTPLRLRELVADRRGGLGGTDRQLDD